MAANGASSKPSRYDEAGRCAREFGFDYVPNDQLITQHIERIPERLEALVTKEILQDTGARAALLGTEKPTAFRLSQLFEEYEAATKDEVRDLSPDQLRIWRTGRKRAVARFVKVVGDKPVTEITESDGIDYAEWWRERVMEDNIAAKSANKDIGQLSRMLKDMSVRRRLNLPIFSKDCGCAARSRNRASRSIQPSSKSG